MNCFTRPYIQVGVALLGAAILSRRDRYEGRRRVSHKLLKILIRFCCIRGRRRDISVCL
jgi:hypothetical protein